MGDSLWRYSVAATAVFGLFILGMQAALLVESPTWLARKERLDDAARAMTRDQQLTPAEVAWMTSLASWVSIAFNPIGGWMADRWGRMRPLVIAKVLAVAGALLVGMAPDYATILFGRFFVGAAYGIDFAIAMAVLAEFTPARLKSRLNVWQGMWYMAVCSNLVLALWFHS